MSILSSLLGKKRAPLMGSPAANDSVRAQLARLGDDGAASRHVLHYAYPTDAIDAGVRDGVISALAARGFSVRDAASNGGVVLEHERSVAPDDFDKLTAELSAWFAERGWDYDGWECAVATPEEP